VVIIGFRIAPRAVHMAHWFLRQVISPGDAVIDATAGNGNDTVFLAGLVGEGGRVFAFDIQPEALERTRDRLKKEGLLERVHLFLADHQGMDTFVSSPVKGVIFNLGYLPGGNQDLVTRPETTVLALKKSLDLLEQGGIACVVVYWAHPGGLEEQQAVEDLTAGLPRTCWDVIKVTFPNAGQAPFVLAIQKKGAI